MKRFFLLLIFVSLCIPHVSMAKTDAKCWVQEKCLEQRKANVIVGSRTDAEIAKGFVQSPETIAVCGKEDALTRQVGFCLPELSSETKTTFGTRNSFTDIGDFIRHMYQYGIIAAAVLAAIMLIVAGFTWTISGGNSERIGSAKKRIAGAITGLLLAVLSYTLLSTINPNLVNIKLPQIYMVNPVGLAPPYCSQLPEGTKLAIIGANSSNWTSEEKEAARTNVPPLTSFVTSTQSQDASPPLLLATCGNDYFVADTDGLTCAGRSCKNNDLCVSIDNDQNQNKISRYRCENSSLVLSTKLTGEMTALLSSIDFVKAFLESVENVWIDFEKDQPELWPVCQNTSTGQKYTGEAKIVRWNRIRVITTKGSALLKGEEMHDYDLIFPKLGFENNDWCNTGILKGVFVMIELKEAGDNTDPDLWIGQASPKETNSTQAVVGTWLAPNESGTRMSYTDYIPVENLKKGVILDVNVTDNVFQTIETYTGTHRINRMPDNEQEDPTNILPSSS